MKPPVRRDEKQRRRRRCDYGSVRASGRDLELLELVGEQYAVTVPQLAWLIGRRVDTARSLRDRWKRAGWVNSGLLSTEAPSFVWLTGRGAAGVESPFRVWQPNHGLALHIEAVTEIRLLLERRLRLGEWECERAVAQRLSADRGQRYRGHLPDAVLRTGGRRVAVEVELSLKNRTRLEEIAEKLSRDYDRVWYFAAPRVLRAVRKIAAENPWPVIDVYSYPPTTDEIYSVSGASSEPARPTSGW
jgi:hypothetical protein